MTGYLLDTHTLLWLGIAPELIAVQAREALIDAPLFVSVVSAAELGIKAGIGKLALPAPFETDFEIAFQSMLDRLGADLLPLELPAVSRLRDLPLHHRDPFDRLIIAQALHSGLAVATRDRAFSAYAGLEVLDV